MMNVIQHDVDLWEVWIEFDPSHPHNFGTLYVHGEITANKKTRSAFKKMGTEDGQLSLWLPPRQDGPACTKEVLYSEPIKNLNQYTSVCIYAGEELIGSFDDIEIMI